MKHLDEYRNPELVAELSRRIHETVTQEWTIMEVCGGQTHALMRFGVDDLLPNEIDLVHGPGCPVCVTPLEALDAAMEVAAMPNVIFCTFGDMLRVPGSEKDLFTIKSEGGDVRVVYSPLDAVKIARENPELEVVFFAVGFETTAPANALSVAQAKAEGLANFSLIVSHVLVPPAMEVILSQEENRVQGFLAAGHVCTIMGQNEYAIVSEKYNVPIVATGFEPVDLLQGILMVVTQLEEGRAEVENQYKRAVRQKGNVHAQDLIADVFTTSDRKWRGIGTIPSSGLELSPEYAEYDTFDKFKLTTGEVDEPPECMAGLILQGRMKPSECPAFAVKCTPENPMGATMVSTEGACSAYWRYNRDELNE